MYNLKRNNYNLKPKASNIQTPPEVSQFIYELLRDKFPIKKGYPILDPCAGIGNLLNPWQKAGYPTYGMDIREDNRGSRILIQNFLTWDGWNIFGYQSKPQLVLCNPPFNGYGKQLGSEVWLDKIIELFGKDIPIVLFAPVGFCANLTLESKRREKFDSGTYPPIVSRITLPKNIFPGVIFHSEILLFNIEGLKGHYFYKPYE